MTSYEQLDRSWTQLQAHIKTAMAHDQAVAEATIARRLAALNATASQSRLDLVRSVAANAAGMAVNPLAGVQVALAGVRVMQAQAAVNDMVGRAANLRSEAQGHQISVNQLLQQVNARIITEFGKGRQTPQRFRELATKWDQISQETLGLRSEIEAHGTTPPWQSTVSAASYQASVVPQLAALSELTDFTANTSAVSSGVATLQMKIFTAAIGSVGAVRATVSSAHGVTGLLAAANQFFHATLTAAASLQRLLEWIDAGIAGRWQSQSLVLTFDLLFTRASVDALSDGWPQRTDRVADAASNVVTVEKREAAGAEGSTTGAAGGTLHL